MSAPWQLVASRAAGSVTSLLRTQDAILATTPAGLRCSHDSGRTWSPLGPLLTPPAEIVVGGAGRLWAGTPQGLHASGDRGQTWTPVLTGSRVLSITPTSTDVLVATEDDGILRSEDLGRTWRSTSAGLQDLTVVGVAVHGDLAYAATPTGVFRSRNGGRAWRAAESFPLECAPQCVALTPLRVLVGSEAHGVLVSPDGGLTWRRALESQAVAALLVEDRRVMAATDAGVAFSDDEGTTWRMSRTPSGPVVTVAVAPDGATLAGLPRHGVLRSLDRADWQLSNDGLEANLVVGLASASDGRLYLAGLEDGIEVSADGGATWAPSWQAEQAPFALSADAATSPGAEQAALALSADATTSAGASGQAEQAAFALSADATYAATSLGSLRRDGAAWRLVHPAPSRAISAAAGRVAALTLNDQVIWSDDAGATWRELTSPAEPTCLAFASDGAFLIGTASGVWRAAPESSCQRVADVRNVRALAVGRDGQLWVGADELVVYGRERATLSGAVTAIAVTDRASAVATSAGLWLLQSGIATLELEHRAIVGVALSETHLYAAELGGRIWRRPSN